MNIHHILMATDLSSSTRSMADHAAGLARRFLESAAGTGVHVTILNVDEVSQFGFHSSDELTAYLQQVNTLRAERLVEARERLAACGVDATVQIVGGDPASQIIAFTEEHQVDLLILAKRGERDIKELILGRTSSRVLRRLKVPTLILPTTDDDAGSGAELPEYRRLIVPTDFSAASRLGLYAALDLAELYDGQIEYVHVIRLPIPISVLPGEFPVIIPQETSAQLRHTLVGDLAEVVGETGSRRAKPSVAIGVSVARTIAELVRSSGADLIAVPSHGGGGVRTVLFGSTTENILKLAPVPVLVFPVEFLVKNYRTAAPPSTEP